MSILRYDDARRILVVTKGHPFERDAFFAMLERWPDLATTAVEQPAAQAFFAPAAAASWDAFLLYDMPGVDLLHGARRVDPPASFRRDFEALVEQGHGFVFLHHAIAGWPGWERYGEVVGARFLYQAAQVGGQDWPDSGYRHDVTHHVRPVAAGHPVLDGIEPFEITDELYLCPVFEEGATPLLRSDARFTDDAFYSASEAVAGRMRSREGWHHPDGSDWIAWAREPGRSRVVTILCGDGPEAYANDALRRLIGNALRWVADR